MSVGLCWCSQGYGGTVHDLFRYILAEFDARDSPLFCSCCILNQTFSDSEYNSFWMLAVPSDWDELLAREQVSTSVFCFQVAAAAAMAGAVYSAMPMSAVPVSTPAPIVSLPTAVSSGLPTASLVAQHSGATTQSGAPPVNKDADAVKLFVGQIPRRYVGLSRTQFFAFHTDQFTLAVWKTRMFVLCLKSLDRFMSWRCWKTSSRECIKVCREGNCRDARHLFSWCAVWERAGCCGGVPHENMHVKNAHLCDNRLSESYLSWSRTSTTCCDAGDVHLSVCTKSLLVVLPSLPSHTLVWDYGRVKRCFLNVGTWNQCTEWTSNKTTCWLFL